jgi:hypothetical protein
MESMHFEPGQRVSFPFEGKEYTGEVDIHQRGWVMIKADVDHKWARLVAVQDSQVRPAR